MEEGRSIYNNNRKAICFLQGIMTEAKTRRKSRITSPVNNIETTNEHTTEEGI